MSSLCPLGQCHQRGKDNEYLRGLFCPSMAQLPCPQHCHQCCSVPACPLGWWVPCGTRPRSQPLLPCCDKRWVEACPVRGEGQGLMCPMLM